MPDITDLSGWTFGAPKAQAADQQPSTPQADITQHDPQTYAELTSSAAIKNAHDMGLMPEVGWGQDIYKKALEDAQAHRTHEVETVQAKNVELAGRQKAVTLGTVSAEEQAKAAVASTAKEAEQGPGPLAQQNQLRAQQIQALVAQGKTPEQAQAIVGQTIEPQIAKLGQDDLAKLDAITGAYDSVNILSDAFNTMMAKPHLGVGGQVRSFGGVLRTFADASSQEALAFSRAKDAALVPIGRGVMGETGASPTKEAMIELAQHTTMPRIEDDDLTGNQGIFQLKQKIMMNLQNMRDNRANAGIDTTAFDKAIAKYNSDFMSDNVQKYNPFKSTPPVVIGTSAQSNAAVDNLHAALGVQKPSMTPGGAAIRGGSVWQPTPAPGVVPPTRYQPITSEGQPYGTSPPQLSPSGQAVVKGAQSIWSALLPKGIGPDDPNLVMPPGSQGPVTWGQ